MHFIKNKLHNKYDKRQITRGVIVFLVLTAIFILYCSWSSVLPVSQSPDEEMRLDVPKFIIDNGFLPRGDDPAIRNEIWGISYAFNVYGSSLIAVPFMLVAKVVSGSLASIYFAARVANNLLCILALFYVYRLSRKVGLQFISSIFAVILLGLWPQFAFLASYFNSEGLEFLSTIMVVFYAYSAKTNNFEYKSCVKWGLAIGILALSYYYAYGAIIASVIYYYGCAIKERKNLENPKRVSKERFILKPLVIFLSAFLVAGWFFIRNAILYNGDFFGMNASSQAAEQYGSGWHKPSQRSTFKKLGFSIISMFNKDTVDVLPCSPWIVFTAKSCVGTFGYFTIHLSEKLFYGYVLLVLPALLLGIVLLFFKCVYKKKILDFVSVVLIIIVPFFLSMYYSYSSDWQPQGRYIMAGFPVLTIVVAYGWQTVFSKLASAGGQSSNTIHLRKSENRANENNGLFLDKRSIVVVVGFCIIIAAEILLASHVVENYIIPLLSSGIMDGLN